MAALILVGSVRSEETSPAAVTLWTTGSALMPAWGLYPNGEPYGGTKPLGTHAAWRKGRLTWVAEFPRGDRYHVFVRRYSGYGATVVSIDETTPWKDGRGPIDDGGSGGRYLWEHLGQAWISSGPHHVDLDVTGMFDAIVFTTDGKFNPAVGPLPEPVRAPTVRASRAYRNDSHLGKAAGTQGFVVSAASANEEMLNDHVPSEEEIGRFRELKLWGAPGQYVCGSIFVRALVDCRALVVRPSNMVSAGNEGNARAISAHEIDLRVVHLRRRQLALFEATANGVLLPDLLLRNYQKELPPRGKHGRFSEEICFSPIPAHESRQFCFSIHIAENIEPGEYRGTIDLTRFEGRDQTSSDRNQRVTRSIAVVLSVLPLDLKPVEGFYSIYHPSQPIDPTQKSVDGNYVEPARYASELRDQVRHGVNAAILYGCAPTMKLAKEAGMTEAPVLMTWNTDAKDLAEAKSLGFPDVFYYGVDEPAGDRIEACRKEAERRAAGGFHMFTAINSVAAQEATKDFIDRPVYSINVFNGPDNPAVMYARSKGFRPISYWTTAVSFPAYYRALSGLYNTRCGYLGTAPWGYQDYPDNRLYDEHATYHAVSYPDENGEPIPTLNWEAFREGIDDVRYLQALDRGIAVAEQRLKLPDPPAALADAVTKAREVRAARFESIGGRLHEYIGFAPDSLDAARSDFAQATLRINAVLNGK